MHRGFVLIAAALGSTHVSFPVSFIFRVTFTVDLLKPVKRPKKGAICKYFCLKYSKVTGKLSTQCKDITVFTLCQRHLGIVLWIYLLKQRANQLDPACLV